MMPDEEITRDVRYVLDDPEVRVVTQTLDNFNLFYFLLDERAEPITPLCNDLKLCVKKSVKFS
jgi:hypothetical protein